MKAGLSFSASKYVTFSVGCLALLLSSAVHGRAQSQDDVTVAFLYNFARFVEWPSTAFANDSAPFTVGFVGRPVLAEHFQQAVQGKTASGREFLIRKLDDAGAAKDCQIVFVGETGQVEAVLHSCAGKPVLCVGEGNAFISAGGMIAFSREGSRLVFDVNPSAITTATLKPSNKLTKAARSVKGG